MLNTKTDQISVGWTEFICSSIINQLFCLKPDGLNCIKTYLTKKWFESRWDFDVLTELVQLPDLVVRDNPNELPAHLTVNSDLMWTL